MADNTVPQTAPQTQDQDHPHPSEMFCLHCRKKQAVSDVRLIDTSFISKKNKNQMSRKTWIGKCSGCVKDTRQFAKSVKAAKAVGQPGAQPGAQPPQTANQ